MDYNATIDIGKNLTSLIERLAQAIGTTADRVFPWYVQQAQIEGFTTLIGFGVAIAILIPTVVIAVWRADYNSGNVASVVSAISGFALALTMFFGAFECTEAVRQVMNPNYYAMKMLTRDLGRLVK
jgi:hypothetical protein